MTIGCPKLSESRGCTMRAVMSTVPPGGKVTMKRIGLTGYCWDNDGAGAHSAKAGISTIIARLRKDRISRSLPDGCGQSRCQTLSFLGPSAKGRRYVVFPELRPNQDLTLRRRFGRRAQIE